MVYGILVKPTDLFLELYGNGKHFDDLKLGPAPSRSFGGDYLESGGIDEKPATINNDITETQMATTLLNKILLPYLGKIEIKPLGSAIKISCKKGYEEKVSQLLKDERYRHLFDIEEKPEEIPVITNMEAVGMNFDLLEASRAGS